MAQFLAKPQRFIVRPAPGWLELTITNVRAILEQPLQSYKFQPQVTHEDGLIVLSDCDFRQAMELTTRVTTAQDIDWVLASSRVTGRSEWTAFIDKSGIAEVFGVPQRIFLTASVTHPVVGTEKDVKEIFQQYLAAAGHRLITDAQAVDDQSPLQRVRVECQKNRTRLLLSMGGDPLYKRGYKAKVGGATAPLPEHHAAACFQWAMMHMDPTMGSELASGERTLVIPFAGTGTTGLEAMCQLTDVAPGVTRTTYGFESWSFCPEATIATIRKRLTSRMRPLDVRVAWGDINAEVMSSLHLHVDAFAVATGFAMRGFFVENDFLAAPEDLCKGTSKIFLPLNPPYGLRLAKESGSVQIYERLGAALARLSRHTHVAGYVICPDAESWSKISAALNGFQRSTCHFSHGGHDTRLLAFSDGRRR
jgi:23S rRNA G2445 N2-methylase RlmL